MYSTRRVFGGDTRLFSRRSGVYAMDRDPDDNGTTGGRPYSSIRGGVSDLTDLSSDMPPPTVIIPFYFDDMLPYNWR